MEIKKTIFNLYYEWWKNIDKFLFFVIILLFIIGLFFSLVSTSLLASDKLETNDYTFFFKHLTFVILGLIIIFILSSINEEKLVKISSLIFILSLFSLILVPIIGPIGTNRIVKAGDALNMNLFWDGHDIVSSLSRVVQTF